MVAAWGWSLHELRAVIVTVVFKGGPRAGRAACAAFAAGPASLRFVAGVSGCCRWAGFRESCVRQRVKRPLGVELLFGRDLHLCCNSNRPKRSRSPGDLSSRLRSPSRHTTMKLSPLRLSMSDGSLGGVPGFLLVPSVTVRTKRSVPGKR